MADIDPAGTPAPRKRRTPAVALVGAGLVGGVVLAGLTTANAQSGQPTPAPSATGAPDEQSGKQGRPGKHGFGGPGKHLGRDALHGEFVTKDADGGFRTMATQQGEVTAVSPTSITVRSEDGFSRTYAVTDDTTVVSANEGIDDVKAGDTVHVGAQVAEGTATAVRIVDVTEAGRLRERWGFRDKGARRPGAPAPSPSG